MPDPALPERHVIRPGADVPLQALVTGYLTGAHFARDLADRIEAAAIQVDGPEALRMLARSLESTVADYDPLPGARA